MASQKRVRIVGLESGIVVGIGLVLSSSDVGSMSSMGTRSGIIAGSG